MDLTFLDPGLRYSISRIMDFQSGGQSEFWKESLFYFYPQIDRAHFESLQEKAQAVYLQNQFNEIYEKNKPLIAEKLRKYHDHWTANRQQVEAAFSDAFQADTHELFNDIVVNITMNPICPRFLQEHVFDIFYLNSPQGALGMSLHELVHFVWFHVWHRHFGDDYGEYETPSLKWVFSEMVVDPIMRDERLRSRNPYFESGCVYEYFYEMQIKGAPILDTLYQMYRAAPITDFMERGYVYCQKHEAEIRGQMK